MTAVVTSGPSANEREKARRRLRSEERTGRVVVTDSGDQTTGRPMRWGRP